MYSVGIDVGYSSVKVMLTDENNKTCFSRYQMHKGKMKDTLKSILYEMCGVIDIGQIQYGAIIGSGSKFLSKNSVIAAVNDVAAVVEGSLAENDSIGSVIDIGGENARFISGLKGDDKSRIELSMNSNCSSGTGSFLEEQMSRLNLQLSDYTELAEKAKSIPRIAGRCSVFAKTDITHHQQEGISTPDILLGLAYALVRNYKGTVMKKLPVVKPVLFSGGVAHNGGIITALKDVLSISDEELVIPRNPGCVGALGAAVMAKQNNLFVDMDKLFSAIEQTTEIMENGNDEIKLPALAVYGNGDGLSKHNCRDIASHTDVINCYLGIDIGSTSTNIVLINTEEELLSYQYLRTLGNPVDAVLEGFRKIRNEFGDRINIVGAGTTGSGRYMIGKMIGADVIKDEITAQAKAAVRIDRDVDTIFEIGGQDSKFISVEKGAVVDFQMNKICAAGTGSFIEEQAKKFGIPIEAFGGIALSSADPINLGERCTVFIETSIASCLSRGAKLDDIVSGLCYSIVRNYLDRVVGQKKIGNKIFFQGGLAYNQGVVNAFRAITGKEIIVPPFFSVTGAYGAAMLAKEEMTGGKSSFRGFDLTSYDLSSDCTEEAPSNDSEDSYNETVRKLVFQDYLPEASAKRTVGTAGCAQITVNELSARLP